MTEEQKVNAIMARINRRYNHPDLVPYGPMSEDILEDIHWILESNPDGTEDYIPGY